MMLLCLDVLLVGHVINVRKEDRAKSVTMPP